MSINPIFPFLNYLLFRYFYLATITNFECLHLIFRSLLIPKDFYLNLIKVHLIHYPL
jgi:hypothetical protein